MKNTLVILVALLFIFCAGAACAGTGDDERMEKFLILATYAAIDYNQSAGWVTPGGGAYELNPILGKHPTRRDMLAFGAAGMGLLWLATEILPEPWDQIALDSALSSEQFNIEDNVSVENGRQRRINAMPIIITFRF